MSSWTPPGKKEAMLSCAILTRAASKPVAQVHDRMPVVLSDSAHNAWLDPALTDGARITEFIGEHALDAFNHHPVSTRVNSPKNRDAELIQAI
jgi:putative SOS response-associated peptidase YedK